MKLIQVLVIAALFLFNLVIAPPALADRPKFFKDPDYIEVTKELESLSQLQQNPVTANSIPPEELQQEIDRLQFQKNALEMGKTWGQCQNNLGKTIAVYGPQPDLDDDDFKPTYDTGLYFLAAGQTTKNKWDCQGIYLPIDVKATKVSMNGNAEDITGPAVVKIPDGTQLIVQANPDTQALEINLPNAQFWKSGEINWFIPNISETVVENRIPDAPHLK